MASQLAALSDAERSFEQGLDPSVMLFGSGGDKLFVFFQESGFAERRRSIVGLSQIEQTAQAAQQNGATAASREDVIMQANRIVRSHVRSATQATDCSN